MDCLFKFAIAPTAALLFFACAADGVPREDSFRTPARETHPETWFHFIGGNVAKGGITADLEAIAGAGISGIQLFHGQFGGPWPGVKSQVPCLSKPWDGMVCFVGDECKRLGLKLSMQTCPGWAMAGGPWIKPENAMRHLVWSRKDVEGGRDVELHLPPPVEKPKGWQDYRDIAVLAFPAPDGDWNTPLKPDSTTVDGNHDLSPWKKGKPVAIPAGSTTEITFAFSKPVTVRAMELPSVKSICNRDGYHPGVGVCLAVDGKELVNQSLPAGNFQDDRPITFACDETTASKLVLTLTNSHDIKLGPVRFFSAARNDDWEVQAGWTLRNLMRNPARHQSPSAWVPSDAVTNVTDKMRPDGSFAWDAPSGKWAIVRVGHVNTGAKNAPAPKEGTGFECDKLSPRGADAQFDNYIGRLSKEGGPVHGILTNMLMDSWECKRQTWTSGLDAIFAKRMGYDLFKWLPAVFGYVVDSPDATARFLNDWRELIAELISDNFYAQMAKRCHENGMTISYETAFGDVIPGDILRFYKYADTPMCEFWQPCRRNGVGSFNYKPVKPCVSAAHLYGKKRVAAESFTSFELTWDEKLRDLKHVANLHLAEEVSHLVFHTYTHNPRRDWLPPGTSFGSRIGTPFLRGQTWWKYMPSFTDWAARCQTMLEAGNTVRDVLWYLGDEWDNRPDHDIPFPVGYRYDYCNPDALLTRLSIGKDGEWRTPDGTVYRVLYIARPARMMPETMEKIVDSVKKGAVVAMTALPKECSTMRPGAAERFAKLRDELKSLKSLYAGQTLESVLKAERIEPDVVGNGIVWNHRRAEGADWYFVAPSEQGVGFEGKIGFRCRGSVEIWHPETGSSEKAQFQRDDKGRTWVSLSLAPHETCFVVFKAGNAEPYAPPAKSVASSRIDGSWHVRFPTGWGMSEEMTVAELKPWKEIGPTPEAKAFSGTAKYEIDFTLAALEPSATVMIDLGRVESLARVEVNGQEFPAIWSYPYRVDVTKAVKQGVNHLKVSVTDTWFNRLVYDANLPPEARRTWTISGPSKDEPLRDSGLLGPVEICVATVSNAMSAVSDNGFRWIDVDGSCVEGRGWSEGLEMPFDRIPKRFAKDLSTVWRNGVSPTGMFFEFESDSTSISVRTCLTQKRYGEGNFNETAFSGVDLYVFDESRSEWRWASATRHNMKWHRETECSLLSGLPFAKRRFRLYLPLRNRLSSLALGVDACSNTRLLPPRADKPVVYYGTSIIHGAFTIRPGLALTSRLERRLKRPVLNLGFSGGARLEPRCAEMLAELDAAIYVCDPYHNLKPDIIKANFEKFFDVLCSKRPSTPVMLVGAPPVLNAWLIPEKAKVDEEKMRLVNELAQKVAARHPNFRYVPGDDFYGSDEVSMDGVHPNDEAFAHMVDVLAPEIEKTLQKKNAMLRK